MAAYSAYTDQELTALLRQGDSMAFDALYWKYHQAIYKNIFKLTKDKLSSQDILQDVFSALWNKRESLHADQSPANWLFTVSFNYAINFTKKRLKEAIVVDRSADLEDLAELYEVEEGDEQYKLLQMALQKLSPQKRRVFELCKLEGKTYDQTALEMNISKHTVKEYLSGAVESIKKFIKDNPGYSETALFVVLTEYIIK
ncbi:RNA polymerase sigma factor [Pedobacter frigoris]|uniref:RNA polymerase sigma factor n=1 Tax=Pedobacter frigoris TaxID=2571272 RepID=UPI002931811D|nr:sigma-70 family RNA polymerase sigma factor [Pedobacter frigoris]